MNNKAETKLKKNIVKWLNSLDNSKFVIIPQNQFSEAGIHDILGCYNGLFVSIEVKTFNREMEQSQIDFLDDIRNAKGLSFEARSQAQVEHIIKQIDEVILKHKKEFAEWNTQMNSIKYGIRQENV